MSKLIEFGINAAKKIAAARFAGSGYMDLAWHEERAFVYVWEIPAGLVGAGGIEVVEFDGEGFATRVYADGRVEERGSSQGKMGWLQ